MTKLTKREKVLLYMLAVFGIVVVGVCLLITPALEKSDEINTMIDDAYLEKADIDSTIMIENGLREDIVQFNKDIDELRTSFLMPMTSDDLDRYITGLMMSSGLVSEALTIIEAPLIQQEEKDDQEQVEQDEQQEQVQLTAVKRFRVQTVARGQISSFVSLAEKVNQTDGIRLTNFSVSEISSSDVLLNQTGTQFSMKIEFEVGQYAIDATKIGEMK